MYSMFTRRRGAYLAVALGMTGLMTSTPGQALIPEHLAETVAALEDPAAPAALPEATEAEEADFEHIGDGVASFYGVELAGNRTASGERFNPASLTAAHRTLPLGSRIRVTNKANGKSVVVRINDRGPFHKGRLIDVSLAAAREIQMVRSGAAKVRLELLS